MSYWEKRREAKEQKAAQQQKQAEISQGIARIEAAANARKSEGQSSDFARWAYEDLEGSKNDDTTYYDRQDAKKAAASRRETSAKCSAEAAAFWSAAGEPELAKQCYLRAGDMQMLAADTYMKLLFDMEKAKEMWGLAAQSYVWGGLSHEEVLEKLKKLKADPKTTLRV